MTTKDIIAKGEILISSIGRKSGYWVLLEDVIFFEKLDVKEPVLAFTSENEECKFIFFAATKKNKKRE
jgi:hypothetical protein